MAERTVVEQKAWERWQREQDAAFAAEREALLAAMPKHPVYVWTEDMDEISGFGRSYELACRAMVVAGLMWLDEHPDAGIAVQTVPGVYGIAIPGTDATRELQNAMVAAANRLGGDPTAAMMQGCLQHVLYARKVGWEQYAVKMRKA